MTRPIEPYRIEVPELMLRLIDDLVEDEVRRTGVRADVARRSVETLVLQRGVQAAQTEARQ